LRLWSMITVLAILAAGGTLGSLEKQNKIIRQVPTTHKVVAFTFDDGPHPGTTPELLKILREKGVKATFFILGRNAETHCDLLKQVIADGHEIGNHGYSHQFLH
ncbi:polysaccharide deacetylase family protein, partial [Anaerospora hongkongensis]|uniref:polysaccharide deacetylase family protein n=1 Tax=Anaerospora hongkongensis TaxID=244830 RepID=UPI0028A0A012